MIANTERVTTRINLQVKETLMTAAQLTGATLNQFVVHAALEKAQQLIEKDKMIKLSKSDAEVFFEALENPPQTNEKLKQAIKHYQQTL